MTDTAIDDPMLDEEWLAAPAKRSRLRLTLALVLAAALCFLGGALVQKGLGTDTAAATATGPTGSNGGQLPEGLGLPGASDDAGSASTDDADRSVIGEVVQIRGDLWIVQDLGGQRHTITVGDDTDVTRETTVEPTQVEVGDPVDITGTDSGGQLQANEVTVR
jgi:uncharacterized protein YdeI (BOF family)